MWVNCGRAHTAVAVRTSCHYIFIRVCARVCATTDRVYGEGATWFNRADNWITVVVVYGFVLPRVLAFFFFFCSLYFRRNQLVPEKKKKIVSDRYPRIGIIIILRIYCVFFLYNITGDVFVGLMNNFVINCFLILRRRQLLLTHFFPSQFFQVLRFCLECFAVI